jgi:hypothetical protein
MEGLGRFRIYDGIVEELVVVFLGNVCIFFSSTTSLPEVGICIKGV